MLIRRSSIGICRAISLAKLDLCLFSYAKDRTFVSLKSYTVTHEKVKIEKIT